MSTAHGCPYGKVAALYDQSCSQSIETYPAPPPVSGALRR